MKTKITILFIIACFFGCKDSLNDKSKRNENWVWWVDAKTGKAGWIPVDEGDPVKNGKYTRFYFNGNTFSTGKLVDGMDVDTIFYYDLSGKLFKYDVPKADSLQFFLHDGPIKLFHSNGKLEAFGIVTNHKYGDKWQSYYRSGGVESIKNLVAGVGWQTEYFENGRVEDSAYVEKGFATSVKHWYENGQPTSVYTYSNGNYNGLATMYFPTGKLKATANYANGKIYGEEKFWYESGQIHAISHRSNGTLNGQQIGYHENGKIDFEYNTKDGKPDGEMKRYDETGKIIIDRVYKNGEVIEDKINRTPKFLH